MKRCSRCILPDTYPGISFDDGGICSFCTNFTKLDPTPEKKQQLEQLVEKAKQNNERYQAIVPISGGKDSAYALYVTRRIYGLRTLAVNFDNGFRSPGAEANLKVLTTKLGVDYISIKPSWDLMRELYRGFLKITGEFCTVCNATGYLMLLNVILQEQNRSSSKILVVGGWSKDLEATPGVYSFDFKYYHDVLAEAGLAEKLRRSPMINEQALDFLICAPDPRMTITNDIVPFNYVMLPEYILWDINEISNTLKNEVGWMVPSEAENETHFDCVMYPVGKYFERRKYGFSQNTVTLSTLVRSGQLSREDALKTIEQEKNEVPQQFAQFLDILGLKETEINWTGKWHPQR
jgi:hypothetical protein